MWMRYFILTRLANPKTDHSVPRLCMRNTELPRHRFTYIGKIAVSTEQIQGSPATMIAHRHCVASLQRPSPASPFQGASRLTLPAKPAVRITTCKAQKPEDHKEASVAHKLQGSKLSSSRCNQHNLPLRLDCQYLSCAKATHKLDSPL